MAATPAVLAPRMAPFATAVAVAVAAAKGVDVAAAMGSSSSSSSRLVVLASSRLEVSAATVLGSPPSAWMPTEEAGEVCLSTPIRALADPRLTHHSAADPWVVSSCVPLVGKGMRRMSLSVCRVSGRTRTTWPEV